MTVDHSSDFDARRIGWWERRRAVRAIKKAPGLIQADRELRLREAGTAQTRGELNVLTRGLSAAGAAQPYVPAPQTYAPSVPSSVTSPSSYGPPTPEPARVRPRRPMIRVGTIVKLVSIALAIGVIVVGGNLATSFESFVDSSTGSSFGDDKPSPELLTVDGWTRMVQDLGEVGDGDVVAVVVLDEVAHVLMPDAEPGMQRRFSYDGDWIEFEPEALTPGEETFDLATVDPGVVTAAVAAGRAGSGAPTSAAAEVAVYVLRGGAGPQISVTFPEGPSTTYERIVDLSGAEVSETP